MKSKEEQWIENTFESVHKLKPATPSEALFGKIKASLDVPDAQVISLNQIRAVAAAAILLLILNVYSLNYYNKSNALGKEGQSIENHYSNSFANNYKLYE